LWTEANGQQHADIPFRPKASPVALKPGETLLAPRPMGARIVISLISGKTEQKKKE
jgi:hypothetical protein